MKLLCWVLPVLLLLLIVDVVTTANEVIGCGGFIKAAQADEINYKIVKIRLVSRDTGVVKYTTEASSVNGYYMIPVYAKGDYLLQVNPPPGWSFEPSEVSISVDGESDPCSKNEDINFFFKGFGLSGKVVTLGDVKSQNGPSGVKLNLLNSGGNKVIDTTKSGADGSYYFSNVMPGEYQVEAVKTQDDDDDMKFSKSKVSVVLSKENWFVKDNIVVSGFSIQGSVSTSTKTGVKDAIVELYQVAGDNSVVVDVKQLGCDTSTKTSGLCQVKTDTSGKFLFTNLPFGKYKLVARLETNNGQVAFHMQPNELQVDLTRHQNIKLSSSFVISSVSIKSSLMSKGVIDVKSTKVTLNGNQIELSPTGGSFLLDKLTTGKYTLSITSPHVYYESKTFEINTDRLDWGESVSELLKGVEAKAFDVCGQVKVSDPSLVKSIQIKCYGSDRLISQTGVDVNTFKYCLKLNAHVPLTLKAEISDDNDSRVLKLVPLEKKLTLTSGPLFDVNFEQLEAKLDGKLILLKSSDLTLLMNDDFKLTLRSSDVKRADWQQTQTPKCGEKMDQNNQTRVECEFEWSNLLFGDYKLTTSLDDLFCWSGGSSQTNGIAVSVDSERQQIRVEQTGYKLNYKLSHSQASIKLVDKRDKSVVLLHAKIDTESQTSGQVCVPRVDEYQIEIDSCHLFTSQSDTNSNNNVVKIGREVFKRNANTISLVSSRHLLQVQVVFKYDEATTDKSVLADNDIRVRVQQSDQDIVELKFQLESSEPNQLVFKSKTWLPVATRPPYILRASSNKVLFESNEQSIVLNEIKCDENVARFEAKLGIFITGRVTSPSSIDSIDLLLKQKNDQSVLSKSSVSSSDEFRLGPLKAPISQYDIELQKSGYLFVQKTNEIKASNRNEYKYEFSAEKLGQLRVSVVDRRQQQKGGLESVLLSLSSEDRSFRQTTKTDVKGEASFDNLKPSLYYLILMMQEYEFSPNSHPIQIADGRQMSLVVEAERIAYSCFGKVTSINGQPETSADILVEAVGVRSTTTTHSNDADLSASMECQTSRENSPLDQQGSYRIRNLKPKCVYELRAVRRRGGVNEESSSSLKVDSSHQLRIVPSTMQITVAEADILNQNFVILTKSDRVDVSVAVSYRQDRLVNDVEKTSCSNNMAPLDYKQIYNFARLRVFKTQQPDHIIQTLYTPANSIAYLNYLPRASTQYTVTVELLMPSSITPYTSQLSQQQQLQLQQQPVLDRLELTFDVVEDHTAYKHLKAEFKFDAKKSDAYSQDLRQQQYQNVYLTLPLFLLTLFVVFNSTAIKKKWSVIQQTGGLWVYVQDLLTGKRDEPVGEIQSIYNLSKKSKLKQQQATSSRDSDSEANRQRKQKTPTTFSSSSSSSLPNTAPSTPLLLISDATASSSSTRTLDTQSDDISQEEESGESVEGDYTILKNPAHHQSTKRKVKKIN